MLNKNWVFLIIMLILTSFVLSKVAFNTLDKNIKMTISQNKKSIKTIDQKYDIKNKKSYFIDIIDFESKNSFVHSKLGNLGFSKDFFVDFEFTIELKKDEEIVFGIESDDGFALFINSKELFSFKKDRPMTLSKKSVSMKKGIHNIKIKYYQGYGQMGIRAFYKSDNKTVFIGQDSDNIKFKKFK